MSQDHRKLDPLEDALLELHEAGLARVFDRTKDQTVGLGARGWPRELKPVTRRRALRLVPVAAAVGMVLLVGAVVFRTQVAPRGAGTTPRPGEVATNHGGCVGTFADFHRCRTGPGGNVLAEGCLVYDFDGDRDVDQADLGARWNCRQRSRASQ